MNKFGVVNKDVILATTLLFLFSITLITVGYLTDKNISENRDYYNDYCKRQGWDGFEFGVEVRCYKWVVHESGVGVERVYSGDITRKEKDEK